MRAEYCVEPTVEVYIDPACEIPDKMRIDDADIYFEISDDKMLKKIKVAYAGLPIKPIKGGGPDGKGMRINPSYPEVNNKAFNLMSGLLNYIQLKTGRPAFDINRLNNISPTISPETPEEEDRWKNCRKPCEAVCHMGIGSVGTVNFDNLTKQFNHIKAYANFADAKNTDDRITKYERLYKVIEYFFSGTGKFFDQNVSNFMIKFDSNFVPEHFEELRQLRNRCVHSKDKNHVTSGDVELLEEVSGKTEKLERIAELLLKHK
jgi:hypothetical protein